VPEVLGAGTGVVVFASSYVVALFPLCCSAAGAAGGELSSLNREGARRSLFGRPISGWGSVRPFFVLLPILKQKYIASSDGVMNEQINAWHNRD
jgi:hypothetical protein